jgi:hypothetical protein
MQLWSGVRRLRVRTSVIILVNICLIKVDDASVCDPGFHLSLLLLCFRLALHGVLDNVIGEQAVLDIATVLIKYRNHGRGTLGSPLASSYLDT